MATKLGKGTVVGQAYGKQILTNYSTVNPAYAGYGSENRYAYSLQFATPAFIGSSETVEFRIVMGIGVGKDANLHYAICTDDTNITNYMGTKSAVSDAYQVASGTLSIEGLTSTYESKTLTIKTDALEPSTTYYLILWSYDDTGVEIRQVESSFGTHSVYIGYNNGIVYIDTGSGADAYQVYIDNGSSWGLCIPHIDNGSGWDMCD